MKLELNKKTNWGKEIILAVIFAIILINLMNLYCGWKNKDPLGISDYEKECVKRGQVFSYYIGYPDRDYIKIGCKLPQYKGFEEVFVNVTG